MNNDLASNIRAYRKERGLTQEQLAEVFGVTVGAVHKWENGMSTPELPVILELADFFDTSLDVLIGFEARDNRVETLAMRLRKMSYTMDPEGTSEAEKALKKYPHNFSVVFECALLYGVYGIEPKNDKYLSQSRALFEQALTLISQNTDPSIDETVIYAQLAIISQTMGDTDKALEIYKAHNAGGAFDIRIGQILAKTNEMNKDIEAILKTAEKTDRKFTKASVRTCLGEVAEKLGVDIQLKGDMQLKMDKDYFETALYCLLDNASKYKKADSKIEVDITSKAVTIRNQTGKEKFTPGTGIAIAGRILEQHKLQLRTTLKDGVFEAKFGKKLGKK